MTKLFSVDVHRLEFIPVDTVHTLIGLLTDHVSDTQTIDAQTADFLVCLCALIFAK